MKFILLFFFFIGFAFSSCKRNNWENISYTKKKLQNLDGVWQSEGYGFVLNIKNGMVTSYDVTKKTGVKRDGFYLQSPAISNWDIEIMDNEKRFIFRAFDVQITFDRINKLPAVCEEENVQPTNDAKKNFDVLWQTFEERYAFFDLRGVTNWKALRDQYRPIVNEENLFDVFSEMLEVFKEEHVTVETNDGRVFDAGTGPLLVEKFYNDYLADGFPGSFDEYINQERSKVLETITQKYLNGQFKTGANSQLIWGILPGNIGYLNILNMSDFTDPFNFPEEIPTLKAALDEAMTDLKNTKGLIMDLRFNAGGQVTAAIEVASRFTVQSFPFINISAKEGNNFIRPYTLSVNPSSSPYKESVKILTSKFTASASEYLVLAMKQLPQSVKLIGESTNGVFSQMGKQLPNGWNFTLSHERITSMDGQLFEKRGIPPDTQVPLLPRQDRQQGIDNGIEKALMLF